LTRSSKGYLYVLVAALLWSGLGPWARGAFTQDITPYELVFFRAGVGCLLAALWAYQTATGEFVAARKSWPLLGLYGVVSIGVFYLCYFWSVQLNTVAVAAVLLYTAPVFVTLLSCVFLAEPLNSRKLAALAMALVGVAAVGGLLGNIERIDAIGLVVGLGSGLTYGLYTIFGKVALRRHSAAAVLPYVLASGTLFIIPFLSPSRLMATPHPPWVWVYLVAGGALGTFLPYLLYTSGLSWVPASNASIVAMVEPVAAAVWGWWLLNESLSLIQLVGGAMVLAGAFMAQMHTGQPDKNRSKRERLGKV